MSSLTGTYLAYTYGATTTTLTTLSTTQVLHRPPGAGELILRVCATALNPVDVQLAGVTGLLRLVVDWIGGGGAKTQEAGKIPGADVSGVVVAVGDGVDKWKVGDEVFGFNLSMTGNGTNQEYLTLPATAAIIPKPPNLPYVEAASLPLVFLTSYVALVIRGGLDRSPDVNARQGAKVLILGASGGTGIIGVQIAKQLGAHVVAVCSGKNAEFVKAYGADEILDYTTQDIPALVISHGPYKVIYDCVGGTDLMPHLSTLLSPSFAHSESSTTTPTHGTYITIVGDKTSRTAMGGALTYLNTPSMLLRMLLGAAGLGPRYYCVNLSTGEEELGALLRWSAESKVKAVLDGEVWGRSQVREAYGRLESGRAKGKVVVDWNKK